MTQKSAKTCEAMYAPNIMARCLDNYSEKSYNFAKK